ncbi:MAG: hypothetical protein WA919_00165 [Coleofasciculaceae cyanobacterium]
MEIPTSQLANITPYTYPPDQLVKIDLEFLGREGTATGHIKGIASHLPELTTTWIVELENCLDNYPYPCIIAPETALTPLRKIIYNNSAFNIRERILDFLSRQEGVVSLSHLHEAMPDLLPGSLDACCYQLGSMGKIHRVTHSRPNGGYIIYFSRLS